ncbi:MAG: ABC transporter substrate-binding protein [Arcobacteraceae bacterium]
MKKTFLYTLILSLFLNNLFAEETLRKVSLQLSWLHQFQFAGYYIAKEKGYYKERGLDVSFKEMSPSLNISKEVLDGVSQYGVGRSSIIIDKIKGAPLVALAAIFQNSPLVLLALENSNIKYISDLKNKRIMLSDDAVEAVSIHAMLRSNGIELNEITSLSHTYNLNDLIEKRVDSLAAYSSNEAYALEMKGIPYTLFNPKDYGFNFYDGVLFSSVKELENNPEDLYNFHKASLKGWQYAFENITETVNLIYNKYNTQNKTLDALIYEAYSLKESVFVNNIPLGNVNSEKIQELALVYSLLGFTQNQKIDLTDFVYNSKQLIFSQKEKEFLKNEEIFYLREDFEPFYLYHDNFIYGIATDIWELFQKNSAFNFHYESFSNSKETQKKLLQTPHAIKLELPYENEKSEENENIIFTQNIKTYPFSIAIKNNGEKSVSMSDLSHKNVLLIKNSKISKKIKNQFPQINFIEVASSKAALTLLDKGEAFAVVDILPTLTYFIKSNQFPNIKIAGTTPYVYNLRYMTHKNERLLVELLNKIIENLDEKEIVKIENAYFKVLHTSQIDYSLLYKIGVPLLCGLFLILLYGYRLKQEIAKRKITEKKLYLAATTDRLTQINNRSHIDTIFQEQLLYATRYKTPLSIIFFDIDGFKLVNDKFGHNLADTVLIDLAALSKSAIRETDYLGRWGGEEFLAILPQTNLAQATVVATHLKEKIETFSFQVDQTITCSFGVTQMLPKETQNCAITRADTLMYYVKAHGKNGVKAG